MVDQTTTENKDSIFSSEETPEKKEETSPDTLDTLLASITAEDGRQKYKSPEDALKALGASQEHIRKLEAEAAELKEKAANAKAIDDVLAEIQANTDKDEPTSSPKVDAKLIEDVVRKELQAKEKAGVAATNTQMVRDALTSKFEDKAEAEYIRAAKEAGISIDQLNNLCAVSPKAVLKLVGLDSPGSPRIESSSGSINPQSLKPTKEAPSAKVKPFASSKDMAAAWRAAGETVEN